VAGARLASSDDRDGPARSAVRVAAIVAAGGRGARMGTAVPKQFLVLGGRTILDRSVAALADCPSVHLVIVALPPDAAAAPPAYLARPDGRVLVVEGGARRQDSVANAFAAVPADVDIVLIHDAARPFVDRATIERTIEAARVGGAAIAALPSRDTVKLADMSETGWVGGEFGDPVPAVRPALVPAVKRTLPRESVFLAQTPQAFRRDVLARAIALGRQGADATDEATLAEQAGDTVLLVPGDESNLKITTAADLAFARGLLLEWGERV
jgi:2-C-methyl-D-erythritol 4-phosphate cytidylyltransferase / 2-C-methyl-D-erythritol 2,4-cyclodiphosphate synthase